MIIEIDTLKNERYFLTLINTREKASYISGKGDIIESKFSKRTKGAELKSQRVIGAGETITQAHPLFVDNYLNYLKHNSKIFFYYGGLFIHETMPISSIKVIEY